MNHNISVEIVALRLLNRHGSGAGALQRCETGTKQRVGLHARAQEAGERGETGERQIDVCSRRGRRSRGLQQTHRRKEECRCGANYMLSEARSLMPVRNKILK